MNLAALTRVQRLVFPHLVLGKTDKEIARAIHRAESTVCRHVSQILKAFGYTSRLKLIAAYYIGGHHREVTAGPASNGTSCAGTDHPTPQHGSSSSVADLVARSPAAPRTRMPEGAGEPDTGCGPVSMLLKRQDNFDHR